MKILSIISFSFVWLILFIYKYIYKDIICSILELFFYIVCLNIIQVFISIFTFIFVLIYDIIIVPFVVTKLTCVVCKDIWYNTREIKTSFKGSIITLSGDQKKLEKFIQEQEEKMYRVYEL